MKKYRNDPTHQAAAIVTGELRTLLNGGLDSYANRRIREAGLSLTPHEYVMAAFFAVLAFSQEIEAWPDASDEETYIAAEFTGLN